MKKVLKVFFFVLLIGALGLGGLFGYKKITGSKNIPSKTVAVQKGTIVEKALATGQIGPRQEIQVKSKISGIVKTCFVEVGDRVAVGDKLFEIAPDPTPLELTEARHAYENSELGYEKAKSDLQRNTELRRGGQIAEQQYEEVKKEADLKRNELQLSKERLSLIKDGRSKNPGGSSMESIIHAPASGTVLDRIVNPGDPVVPLTSYQAGTPLLALADMGDLIFKGTVDEIDVGKLREGQEVRISIGALPKASIKGKLLRISPKGKEKEGGTFFDVEIGITDTSGQFLRAGYSANADIVIQEKKDVLLVPERVVTFEGEKSFVELPAATSKKEPLKQPIEIGLSDGLNVEITKGLKEGDLVLERPPKEVK